MTSSRAGPEMTSGSISEDVVRHLVRCGYSREKISTFNGETRLFQDIGLFGDNAFDELILLEKEFGVDFSGFEFSKYFPGNFGWDALILRTFWNSTWANRVKQNYKPITLNMLGEVIRQKKWMFD